MFVPHGWVSRPEGASTGQGLALLHDVEGPEEVTQVLDEAAPAARQIKDYAAEATQGPNLLEGGPVDR
jgi:hypothetical protein